MSRRLLAPLLTLLVIGVASMPVAPAAASYPLTILGLNCYLTGVSSTNPNQGVINCYTEVSGGSGSYTFQWAGNKTTVVTSQIDNGGQSIAEGLCSIGSTAGMTVQVTDSNWAIRSASRTLPCAQVE